MTLGEQIRKKRKKDRISAEDLAIKLGLKKENIYKWERGSKPSDPEDYIKINMWLTGAKEENVPHEILPNSKNSDHEKYVALLESTNKTLEKAIQLSLNAILENQLLIKARLNATAEDIQDLLVDNGRKIDDVRDETNKRMAAHLDALMKTGRL